MGKCAVCGERILFGGKKQNGLRYCNSTCLERGAIIGALQDNVSEFDVEKLAAEIHGGICSLCNRERGSVDVYFSHLVFSYIWGTSWRTIEHICCRSCARKKQGVHLLSSFFLGWWGVPWGTLITPVQVFKNLVALLKIHDSRMPSDMLKGRARFLLAQDRLNNPVERDDAF